MMRSPGEEENAVDEPKEENAVGDERESHASGDEQGFTEKGNEDQPYHEFSKEELDRMMYEWDGEAAPVQEYHYFKPEWFPEGNPLRERALAQLAATKEKADAVRGAAVDNGERTEVDLKAGAAAGQEPVYLTKLDTDEAIHVVEFYAPWCPHCQHFKWHYIDVAREVNRRAIGVKVEFHAVSCEMYRPLCIAYGVNGFPLVLGYPIGSNILERGVELNPIKEPEMTADRIADWLEFELAHEAKSFYTSKYSNSEDQRLHDERVLEQAKDAIAQKTEWHEYESTINERYHNAAVSLAFAIKSEVYMTNMEEIEVGRSLVLKDFLHLIDWATPESWHVRNGMVRDMLDHFSAKVEGGRGALLETIEGHQSLKVGGGLWGDLDIKGTIKKAVGLGGDVPDGKQASEAEDPEEVFWANNRWSDACSHDRPAMGFTCGLWDLFHIVTIGVSLPDHQLYGFRSGYVVAPSHVASVVRGFVANFFPCDVCRWNFLDMYDSCGYKHCKRLSREMPVFSESHEQASRELALWLWEVHNGVNVRLMKESAEREHRVISDGERVAGKFPTYNMCPECWKDEKMQTWDSDAVFTFLKKWYWPKRSLREKSFQTTLKRRLLHPQLSAREHHDFHGSWFFVLLPLGYFIYVLFTHVPTGRHAKKV